MEILRNDVVRYVIAGVILVLLLVIGRKVWVWLSTREDRELEAEMRAALDEGNLRRAGDIQMQRGNHHEALRIFQRAGAHSRAATVLQRLGEDKKAAEEYEQAEEWARAAPLYRKTGEHLKAAQCYERSDARSDRLAAAECFSSAKEHLKAGRLFQDLEEYEKAAECFAKVEDLDSLVVALTMLENAALAKKSEPDRQKELWKRAGELATKAGEHERAARAFDEAGELKRAAGIYEKALKMPEMAAVLYAEAGADADAARLIDAVGAKAVNEKRRSRALARGERGPDDAPDATRVVKSAIANEPTLRVPRSHEKEEPGETVRFDTADSPAKRGSAGSGGSGGRLDDRFELMGELGRGGMGVVHRAKDLRLGRFVALKFLPEDVERGSTLHRLFQREARAAAALSHAGIVTVYDVGELDGREFIAMELVEGRTLDRVLDEDGPLPLPDALDVMEKALVALEYAHGKSVIHRDLKPANLMVAKSGVKIMDFGLAKVVSARSSSGQTVIGGTPSYMPPEQRDGNADHRSDVFSIGATFYEAITGVLPGNPGEPASKTSSYPTVKERVPKTPARLSDLIMRCLEHDRSHRPQDVTSVLRELREIRAELAARPAEPAVKRRAEPEQELPPPKPVVPEAKPKRAPLPRISREEEDEAPRVERVERVGPSPAPAKPARGADRRPDPRADVIDVVDEGARRGKPR